MVGGLVENWGFDAMRAMFRNMWDDGTIETRTEISGISAAGAIRNRAASCGEIDSPKRECVDCMRGGRLGRTGVELFGGRRRLGRPAR